MATKYEGGIKKSEVRSFIGTAGGVIPRLLRLMYKEDKKNKMPSVKVGIGGGAWTNPHEMYLGLYEGFINDPSTAEMYAETVQALGREPEESDAWLMLKANGFHELAHIFWTDWREADKWAKWWDDTFKELWDGKDEVYKSVVEKLGRQWFNCVEDGRIEELMVNEYPGTAKGLQFTNLLFWAIHSKHPSESKFANFSMALCFYATSGIIPEWWNDQDAEMQKNLDKIKADVDKAIGDSSAMSSRRIFQNSVTKIRPFILKLLKEEMSQADMLKALKDFLEKMYQEGEFEGCEAQQGGSSSGGGGATITIRMNGKGSGSGQSGNQNDNQNQRSDGDGESGASSNDKQDGSGSGEGDGDEDKDDKDDKGGKNGEGKDEKGSGKNGKDKQEGDEDGEGNGKDEKSGRSIDKENRAPGHAQRGGNENGSSSSNQANNNGQGTSSGNVAPDNTNENITETKGDLVEKVKEQLDAISEGSQSGMNADINKGKKLAKDESQTNEGLTEDEVNEIRKGYKSGAWGRSSVEGYKEVLSTAKEKADSRVAADGRRFRKEIEKLLKAQQDTCIRGTTRGRLSPSMLYRMQRNDFGIFETKSTPDKTNAAVYILWDNSGSMCGAKQRLSTIACSVIEEGLKGLVPLKITAFTTESGMVKHFRVKGFNDKDRSHNYAWSHGNGRYFNGGNKDGYSIKVATTEMMKRSEQLKLLIVLSDGLPSDYPSTQEAMDDVRDAVKDARKNGVEVISVMFGEDDFRSSEFRNYEYMYKSGIIATSPEKLTGELIKQIRKILFNKGR